MLERAKFCAIGAAGALLIAVMPGGHAVAETSTLSAEQRQWVADHPTIRVGLANQGPFAFADRDGAVIGLSIDYLARIGERSGLRFETHLVANVSVALEGVERGELDAVMGLGKTEEREKLLLFGAPYAYSPDAIVTRADSQFLFDLHELAGRRVAIARSSKTIAQKLRNQVEGVAVVEYDTMSDALIAVANGDAVVAVTDASIAAFTIKKLQLTNLRVAGIFSAPADVYIGVRKDWPLLLSVVDRAILAIPAAERTQLMNQWMALDYESDRRWQRAFSIIAALATMAAIVIGMLLIFARRMNRELALRRRVQSELVVARDELERISEEKSELLRMVSHDLRNPLTSLMINVQMLSRNEAPSADEVFAEMQTSINQMQALISLLVDRQAIEFGERAWTWTTFDPVAETASVVSAISESAKKKRIEVHLESSNDVPMLTSDHSAFRQVVDNLVSNAVKYSPSGSLVRVKVSSQGSSVRLCVIDQGPGVPPAERESIFTKYGVGSARPTGGETSTGLGLWIVMRIVEKMHGRAGCGGELGGGAEFWVELPAKVSSAESTQSASA